MNYVHLTDFRACGTQVESLRPSQAREKIHFVARMGDSLGISAQFSTLATLYEKSRTYFQRNSDRVVQAQPRAPCTGKPAFASPLRGPRKTHVLWGGDIPFALFFEFPPAEISFLVVKGVFWWWRVALATWRIFRVFTQ